MQLHFTHPTLVTLTAPSCAGKSFLLEALISELGFQRIVSTTDRAQRAGEVQGVHYDFLTTEQSKQLEADNKFAELVTFNGTRYGVTHEEMAKKMVEGAPPPMVILEPNGVQMYREYCSSKQWNVFTIFVETAEEVRISRLASRSTDDILAALGAVASDEPVYDNRHKAAVRKVIDANNKRLAAILSEERLWVYSNPWDVVVDGTNLQYSLQLVQNYVAARNESQQ